MSIQQRLLKSVHSHFIHNILGRTIISITHKRANNKWLLTIEWNSNEKELISDTCQNMGEPLKAYAK